MGKLKDYTDKSWKHCMSRLRVVTEESNADWPLWLTASWTGPYGEVDIVTFISRRHEGTRLNMTVEGVSHQRSWEHTFGKKTLAKLAREFSEELYIRAKLATLKLDTWDVDRLKRGVLSSSHLLRLEEVRMVRDYL